MNIKNMYVGEFLRLKVFKIHVTMYSILGYDGLLVKGEGGLDLDSIFDRSLNMANPP